MPSRQDITTEIKDESAAVDGGASSISAMSRVLIRAEHCVRPSEVPCESCLKACPHGAVSFDDDFSLPQIDSRLCTGCCACSGVCDAFAPSKAAMEDVAARALRASAKGDPMYVVCGRLIPEGSKPAVNTALVPCLAACSPEFWTRLLVAGTELCAVCDFEACASCDVGGEPAIELYSNSIETAQSWTGAVVRIADSAPTVSTLANEYARNEASDRRDLLKKMAIDVTEAANGTRRVKTSSVLQDFHARKERLRLTVRQSTATDKSLNALEPEGGKKRIRTPRRTLLFQAALAAEGMLDGLEIPLSTTDQEACDGNGHCIKACPHGARRMESDGICVDPQLCTGCGACARSCPTHAASVTAVPIGTLIAETARP